MIGVTPNHQTDVVECQSVCVQAILNRRRKIETATAPSDSVTLDACDAFAGDRRNEFAVHNQRSRSFVVAKAESKYVHRRFPSLRGDLLRTIRVVWWK